SAWQWKDISVCCTGNSLEDDITASSAEVFSSEGRTVTVSCNYSVQADNLQWYRQDPGSAPQFLLLITDTSEPSVVRATPPNPRLTAALDKERNRVNLEISSAAVSDSAVYYCALHLVEAAALSRYTDCISLLFFFLFPGLTAGDSITPQQPEVTETEGESVKLTCSYETSDDIVYLHWYRHDSDLQAPQFILWKGARSRSDRQYIPDKRYKTQTTPTSTTLTITALTLADTALYYCALETQ
uniref:Ig-like domain-containing protein n=1 Tax=Maylandia zebra TaxID=106582 RepID=A0A3P9DTC0_9CICH